MKAHDKLETFSLVHNGEIISPALVTTREYGVWFSYVFDNYTSSQTLCCRSKTKDGGVVLESHPGTRIGAYFDKNNFSKYELKSWYIDKDSEPMKKLVKYHLADIIDCSHYGDRMLLRVYTVDQIQLYIQTTVDRQFKVGNMMLPSKQIIVNDLSQMIRPELKKKKSLF